jgi:Fe-S-cluster containining protein
MLFNDPEVPEEFIETNARGDRSMARLKDGWCAALDRETMACTIYEKRPWICREFEVGEDECLAARASDT